MSHTPGPWKVGGKETVLYGAEALVVFEPKGQVVAAINPHTVKAGDDSDRTNARLIAAAPQMLEALQDIHTLWDFAEPIAPNTAITYNNPSAINEAMAKALSAIRAATGGAK